MDINNSYRLLENELDKEKWEYSSVVAEETVKTLGKLISQTAWQTADELLTIIKVKGKALMEAHPLQTAVGNMVRRVLKIVREEYSSSVGKNEGIDDDMPESLERIIMSGNHVNYKIPLTSLKESIEDSLRELLTEMETSPDNIAAQSFDHIHSDDVIMTCGKSRTVEKFLKKASTKRKFQVIVVESAPFYHGHKFAKSLAEAGIETTLIHDCAIFAIMSRVNKVIIGTHSVMANGGLKAPCGVHTLALAAKHQSVPLIVCAPMFKLTPQYFVYSKDQQKFNHLNSPQDVLPYGSGITSDIEVINPAFDYVPPELVTLLVSNIGGNCPSYVYKLMNELYHVKDYNF